ncbi:MAG: hypothetical protein ACRDWS_04695 [Acidimicrobiia bacterium]
MGAELVAFGGAFLATRLLAWIGKQIGVPTIVFFMTAGIWPDEPWARVGKC